MNIDLQIQKPLRELVYLELKHKILTGEIQARTRLMEIDLAERMNVSRTPIREAIRELATDGLLVIEPRRGAYVSDIWKVLRPGWRHSGLQRKRSWH